MNIGILGQPDCGKTSIFIAFIQILEAEGDHVLKTVPGGPSSISNTDKITTITVDFLRFTWKGFIHVLYGTGGHKNPSTIYYRDFVLRNADEFLCMIDLSQLLEPQLNFFQLCNIPSRSVVISFNKYDLGKEKYEKYKIETINFFQTTLKKLVKKTFPTIAVDTLISVNENYEQYYRNCFEAITSLCSFDNADLFFNK